jgi:hypothetical protein
MQKIPLKSATSGMILARDVFRGDTSVGAPICGKGTGLTDTLIARFGHMDIQSVYVEGHPVWEEGDRSLDELLRELDARFSKTIHEPLNAMLYDIYKTNLINSMRSDCDSQTS